MARKPAPETPVPAPALPAAGGAYELVDGQLRLASPGAEPSETAPETASETGA